MIPKKIHYIWLGGNKKPDNFEMVFNSWKTYATEFEIIEWTESNIIEFDLPEYYHNCIKLKKWAFASDALRFLILEKYGGIYLDIDQVLIKKIDTPEILDNRAIISKYHEVDDYYGFGFVGCEQGSVFTKKVNEYYKNYSDSSYFIVNKAGSEIINESVKKSENIIHIVSQDYFYPLTDSNRTENTYSYHLSNTSWVPAYKKVLQKLPFYKPLKSLTKRLLPRSLRERLGFNIDYL